MESFAFGGTAPTEALEEGVQEKKVGEPKNAWALPYCVGMSHLAWITSEGEKNHDFKYSHYL